MVYGEAIGDDDELGLVHMCSCSRVLSGYPGARPWPARVVDR
jgi:hypothetical protein